MSAWMLALALVAQPPAAAGPPVVVQAAPVERLLADVKAAAKMIAGDMAAEQVTKVVADRLGEKGFAGIDATKPLLGYLTLPDSLGLKADDPMAFTNIDVLKKLKGAVLIPVTTEEAFKDFVARATEADPLKLTPVPDAKGLYAVESAKGAGEVPVRLRFHAGHAYVGVNLTDAEMAADKLPTPATLANPKEQAAVAIRYVVARVPAGLQKEMADANEAQMKKLPEMLQMLNLPAPALDAVNAYMKLAGRYSKQMTDESAEAVYRLEFDRQTGEFAYELAVVPKEKTSLAADLATRKPTANNFANLVGPDAAAGFKTRLPLFAPEIREAVAAFLGEAQKMAADHVPPPAAPLVEELFAGLTRTVKTGEFDLAGAVTGPDKDGHFGAVVAVAFDDAGKLERALRAAVKNAPAGVAEAITFDADKAGDIAIHKIVPPNVPAEANKIFGATAIYVAFGPKAVYAAIGLDAAAAIKKAVAAKPADAKVFDVVVNPKRLAALVAAADADAGTQAEKVLGTDDKPLSAVSIDVRTGADLRIRIGFNLKLLPRAAGATAIRN